MANDKMREEFEKLVGMQNAENPSGHQFDLTTCDFPCIYADSVTAMCYGFFRNGYQAALALSAQKPESIPCDCDDGKDWRSGVAVDCDLCGGSGEILALSQSAQEGVQHDDKELRGSGRTCIF